MFRASKNRFETTSTVAAFFQVPRRIRNLSAPAAKARLAVLAISSLFVPIVFSESSAAQSAVLEANDSSISATAPMLQNQEIYIRPTHRVIAGNYAFDTFGPYPISGAVLAAGINQLDNSPPEWNQDAAGFGKRVGSNFGIAAIGTTTRYSLAEVFREDAHAQA